MTRLGVVYLVGAGPGRPGLITVEGARRLRDADVVVSDYLANPRLLDHAGPQAERILVGKHGGGPKVDQAVINELLIDRAREGQRVVRLKGGDPFVFGRGAEEAQALCDAGVPFEIVPGVSSAVAVAAYAGIPITDRDRASSFTVLTGYQYPDKAELAVRWDAVARCGGTLVLLMTTRQLRNNMAKLVTNGMAADIPVAVVRWGTVAEQQVVTGTAATIAELAESAGIGPPALAIVGEVVRLREKLNWFEHLPLFGRRIVVTRPRAQAQSLVETLEDLGADVFPFPTIEIVEPDSWQPVDAAIEELESFDWVVFTSVNGVSRFFERMMAQGVDARSLHRANLAAVGPATGRALAERSLSVDVVPGEYRAEGVAAAMSQFGLRGKRVLLPRASAAREILPRLLREEGADVNEVHVYNTVAAGGDADDLRQLLDDGAIDMVTFTSSSTVRNFVEIIGDQGGDPGGKQGRGRLRDVALACIGPITAETVRDLGYEVAVSADEYTVDGLTRSVIEYFARTTSPGE